MTTAIARRITETTDITAIYRPDQFQVLSPVKVYEAPPPFMQRTVVPVNITLDDYHEITSGKNAGKLMKAATWLQKVAAAMGWQKDEAASGFVEPPARTHPEDIRYNMVGTYLSDEGRVRASAQYTWSFEHRKQIAASENDFATKAAYKEQIAETGALSRIICTALGVKRMGTKEQAKLPVLIVRNEPDLRAIIEDPEVGKDARCALAARALGATQQLFGGPRMLEARILPEAPPLALGDGSPEEEEAEDVEPEPDRPTNVDADGVMHGPEAEADPPEPEVIVCFRCGKPVTEKALEWSRSVYGASLTDGRDACTTCGTELYNEAQTAKEGK